jgi:2-hydroxychromene-2-carboxylate isomerase
MADDPSVMRFYFDFQSPYAYLAWTRIYPLAARFALPVEPIPILFAALLDAHGTLGPVEVPARRRYLIRDVARIAHAYGVPLELPPAHPFNPLPALRLASLPMDPELRRALVDRLFRASWAEGAGVTDPAVVRSIATHVGLPAASIEEAGSAEAKARLRAQTEEAIQRGIFGVPTMVVRGQLFWGCDSLPHLERFLAHGDVVGPELVDRWQRLPATAARPGATRPPGG